MFAAILVLGIWPLRAVTPAAWIMLLLGAADRRLRAPAWLLFLSALEACFHCWYIRAVRRLQSRHVPPNMTPSDRRALLATIKEESGGPAYHFLDAWFPGAIGLGGVGRKDLQEWLAWAFFGLHLHEVLTRGARREIEELTRDIERSVAERGVVLHPQDRSGTSLWRLNLDAVTSMHRPMLYYVATAAMGAVAALCLYAVGFRRHASGSTTYYLLKATSPPQQPPVVFVHGVGMGLSAYLGFVLRLATTQGARRCIMMIELPHVSMKLGKERVPSAAEIVDNVARAMHTHGFVAATWVGHSLGSCTVATVVRARPELVHSLVFLDPVCFLLWEVNVMRNFCYLTPSTPRQHVLRYVSSGELFISYYFHRHFWWHELFLLPSHIPSSVASTSVFVSENDDFSNAAQLQGYLRAKGVNVHELKGHGHGGWMVCTASQERILATI